MLRARRNTRCDRPHQQQRATETPVAIRASCDQLARSVALHLAGYLAAARPDAGFSVVLQLFAVPNGDFLVNGERVGIQIDCVFRAVLCLFVFPFARRFLLYLGKNGYFTC